MSIEQALADNTAALKALAVILASGAAVTGAPTSDKKATDKKPDAKGVDTKAAGPDWKTTLDKIKQVHSSKLAKAGKAGVVAILAEFGKPDDKVPALEAVGKNAEIIAFADALLVEDAAGDDLGI